MARLEDRIAALYEANPTARYSTADLRALLGGTPHSIRQAVLRLRRWGMPLRAVRVYQLRSSR